jgi:hypothetical protein
MKKPRQTVMMRGKTIAITATTITGAFIAKASIIKFSPSVFRVDYANLFCAIVGLSVNAHNTTYIQ